MNQDIKCEHSPGQGKKVLFVLGWGVRLEDAGIRWFFDKARREQWNLMAVQIPASYRSFDAVLEQIRAVHLEHRTEAIVSFSMGSLFSLFLETPKRIFISPYWGNPKRKLILGSFKVSRSLMRLLSPIRYPIIPRGFRNRDVGSIDVSKLIPSLISPSTVYEVIQAQERRPKVLDTDTIFYCPQDSIIATSLCRGKTVHTFEGGHDFMATPDRDMVFGKIAQILRAETDLD